MKTAKLFANGGSQAVRLPKECQFEGTEVGYKKVGGTVLLFPANDDTAWLNFINGPPASDDFGEAIFEARKAMVPDSPRESL
jgi:antitoxin VapB